MVYIFFPQSLVCLLIFLMVSLKEQKFLILLKSSVCNSFLWVLPFRVIFKKSLYHLRLHRLSPMFSSWSCKGIMITIRSMIHFEVILRVVRGEGLGPPPVSFSLLFLSGIWYLIVSAPFLKNLSFPIYMSRHPCWKSMDCHVRICFWTQLCSFHPHVYHAKTACSWRL